MRVRFAILALLALLLAPAGAQASVAQKRTAAAQSPTEYWTQARMRNAIPADAGVAAVDAERSAEPARGGGNRAQQVPDPQAPEVRMHGKVFFKLGRGNYMCSGTVVGSRTDSTVLTAGHCVENGRRGGFARRWIFVPAYSDGRAPFGEWPARKLATTPGYAKRGDLSYDVGAAKLKKQGGRKIAAVVGERRVRFGKAPRRITTFGYPAVPNTASGQRFNGKREWSCESPLRSRNRAGRGPKSMRIGCDMTAGASGGGWLSPQGDLIGVLSYVRRSSAGWDNRDNNSPFLGKAARKVYRAISR